MDCIPGSFISLWLVSVVYGDKWIRGDPAFDNLLRPDDSDFHVRSLLECGKTCALLGPCSGFSHSKFHEICQLHEESLALEVNVTLATMRFYERSQEATSTVGSSPETTSTQSSTTPTTISTLATTTTTSPSTTLTQTTTSPTTTQTPTTTIPTQTLTPTTTLPTPTLTPTTTTTTITTTTTPPATTTAAVSTTTTATCPSLDTVITVTLGGVLYNLLITQTGHTETAAISKCGTFGTTLAKVDTVDKQNTLSNMLVSCPGLASTSFWIDGERNNMGNWVYTGLTAMSLDDTSLWATGSPRTSGTGDCVLMRASMSYRWDNAVCSESHGVICLKKQTTVVGGISQVAQPIAT